MHAVLVESDAVQQNFKPNHVHDLRVALRRCRSIAQGLAELDPDPAWTRLRKEAKKPLAASGKFARRRSNARLDCALACERQAFHGSACSRSWTKLSATAIRSAEKELSNFDKKQWRKWTHHLPSRSARILSDSPAAELLALERWHEAWEAHRHAIKTRSKTSLHRVRIALKRFRYSVENFLPTHSDEWGRELKKLQDLLGEIHDLDVLMG